MNVVLLSMPDYFEHMPPVAVRMPNGALTSLAGNVDAHHQVAVADLILSHRQVRGTVTRLVREFDPDVVGLSVMTFQRRTAGRIINLLRALKPGVKVVVGGYDPSLAGEAYEGMEVRGRNFHTYRFHRILADITDARDHGARTIFLVDDNITLNVHRFEALCHAIIDAGLNKLDYFVQAMTSAIATHGKTLAPLMREAGFRYVFLGIENILEGDLQFLRATAKNTERDNGQHVGNASVKAIDYVRQNKMFVVGGLIMNQRLEEYDGTTAVVRTEHVAAEEVEYLRWKAERWMKIRHMPAALLHDPWFVVRHGPQMLAHTFRGCTLRSVLGLEDEWRAFERYKAIRNQEREYV